MGEKAASSADLPESPSARRRKKIGWCLTAFWGLASITIAFATWDSTIKFHDLMEAVAAAFGPIALLWLILGYQQQGEELAMQRLELELQRRETSRHANEAARQATALANTEMYARRDLFLKLHELAHVRMNVAASRIMKVLEGRVVTSQIWDQYGHGDEDVFFNRCTNILVRRFEYFKENFLKYPSAVSEADQYEYLYNLLIAEACAADRENSSIVKLLEYSGMANLMYVLGKIQGKSIIFTTRKFPEELHDLISPMGE